MNKIVLVFGPSGCGKSTLIRYLCGQIHNVTLLKKYSTRNIREYEKSKESLLDNNLITQSDFDSLTMDCIHTKHGVSYGVRFKDINILLSEGKFPIFAAPSLIFKGVSKYYGEQTMKVLIKSTIVECEKRINEQNMTQEQRLLRIQYWKDYEQNERELNFDVIIDNCGTLKEYKREIDKKLTNKFFAQL